MLKKKLASGLLILCMLLSVLTMIPPASSSVEVSAAGSGNDVFSALGVSTDPSKLAGYDAQADQKARSLFGLESKTPEYDELYMVEANETTTVTGHGTGIEGNSSIIPDTPAYSTRDAKYPFDDEKDVRASISFPFSVPSPANRTTVAIEQGVAILYATDTGLYLRTTDPLGADGFNAGKTLALCSYDFSGYKDFELINLLCGTAGDFDGDGFSEIAVVVPVTEKKNIGTSDAPNEVDVITGRKLQVFAQNKTGNMYWFDMKDGWSLISAEYTIVNRSDLIPNSYALSAGKLTDNGGKDSLILAEGAWKWKNESVSEVTALTSLIESSTATKLHVFLELSLEDDILTPDFSKELTGIVDADDLSNTIMRAGVAIQELPATKTTPGGKTIRRGVMVGGTLEATYEVSEKWAYPDPYNVMDISATDRLFFFTLDGAGEDLTLFDAADPVTTTRNLTESPAKTFVPEFQCTSVVAEFKQAPHLLRDRYHDYGAFIEADRTIYFNGTFNEVGRYTHEYENIIGEPYIISNEQSNLMFLDKEEVDLYIVTGDIRENPYYKDHYVYGVFSGRTEKYSGREAYAHSWYEYTELFATEFCFFSRAADENTSELYRVERTRDPNDGFYHMGSSIAVKFDNYSTSFGGHNESKYHQGFANPVVSLVQEDVIASTFFRSDTDATQYTFNRHQVEYSDPNIAALLAAPPHFADLASLDGGDSASFSSTQLDDTVGSGTGSSMSHHFSVGPYVSFEQDISIFGVKIASFEAEVEFKFGGEWTSSRTVTTEYTTTYGTTGGQDTVVLTIIPYDAFYFDVHMPTIDENGDPATEVSEASYRIPYKPINTTMSLERYNKIAKAYGLDVIGDDIVKHKVGYPETYTYSDYSYQSKTPRTVGIGNAYTGESITITEEKENVSAFTFETNFRVGGGVGGFSIGVSGTYGLEKGTSQSSILGVTYSGTMYDLPEGPESENYIFSWQISEATAQAGKQLFPYVRYNVTDVHYPVKLPKNFRATDTTTDSVTLKWDPWDPSDGVTKYEIFRKAGNYWLLMEDTSNDSIVIGGLTPYQEYEFAIRSVNENASSEKYKYSAKSEPVTVKTRAGGGAPSVKVLEKRVTTFLGGSASLGVTATPFKKNNPLYYQWEKQENSGWVDVYNENSDKMTIMNCNINDIGLYRCVVLESIDGEVISTESDVIEVIYGKVPTKLSLELQPRYSGSSGLARLGETVDLFSRIENSSNTNHPTGEVVYTIKSLDPKGEETRSASIRGTDARGKWVPTALGTYEIVASYSGNHFYGETKSLMQSILIVEDTSDLSQYYTITPTQNDGGSVQPGNVVYQKPGTTRTFDIIPDTGYNIEQVLVDGQAVTWTEITNKDGKKIGDQYTFSDISEDHTISAEFVDKIALKIDQTTQSRSYTGKTLSFIPRSGNTTALPDGISVTYEQDTQAVRQPIEKGTYDVIIFRAEDDNYQEVSLFIPDGLIITDEATPIGTPRFTKNLPNAAVVTNGGSLKLTVAATASNGVITYQWFKDGVAVTDNRAGASYTISAADKNKVGKYHVEATNTHEGQTKTIKSVVCTVSLIKEVPATKLTIQPSAATLTKSKTYSLKATMTPTGSTDKITWKSSDTKIATVSTSGLVTAVSAGKATITAQTTSGKKSTSVITVINPLYVSLCINSQKAITNGTKTTIDKEGSKPFILSGRTMIPLRFVSEKMNAKVKYVNDKTPISIWYGHITVEIKLGSKTMTVIENGKRMKYVMDVAPLKKGGRTYIPLRSIWQALDFSVYYDSATEIIIISNPRPTTSDLNSRLVEAEKYMKKR